MDNKRKCLCSAYGLEREGVCVSGKRGCCARQGTEQRRLHENQQRRKSLRGSGWLGGGKGVGTGRKRLCMTVKKESAREGLGSGGVCEQTAKRCEAEPLWVAEMYAVPAPFC